MGLFNFIKDAGEKIFSSDNPSEIAEKIKNHIEKQYLGIFRLDVLFDGETKIATLNGVAPDVESSEKASLSAGNISGVSGVNNQLKVLTKPVSNEDEIKEEELITPESEKISASRYHDVEKGDTLSAIAKKYYGDANQYQKIFEANKPMLTDPSKIYVGQKLRIPE